MKVAFATILMAALLSVASLAQPVLTPRNIALGGGGSTYINDYNANFLNPANLLIRDRNDRFSLGFLNVGSYYNGVLNSTDIQEQVSNYRDYLQRFQPGAYDIVQEDRDAIIDINYKRDRLSSIHQSRFEATLLGFRWQGDERAFSLAMRTRTAGSFEVGRGWYSAEPVSDLDGNNVIDRSLRQRRQTFHEISLGYAESVDQFNGMSSRLDNFLIGIAPKLVLAGPFMDASWTNTFTTADGITQRNQRFEYTSAGEYSMATQDYMNGISADASILNNISPLQDQLQDIRGLGAGMDIGITYLITYGNDLSILNTGEESTQKSLRLSFSITDIGFVHYRDGGVMFAPQSDSLTTNTLPQVADEVFAGAPGQFLDFVSKYASSDPFTSFNAGNKSFSTMLPTALHGGVLLELNRLKLMGDMSIGLKNSAFSTTKLVTSLGVEVRPLKFLPLRAGTQVAPGLPGFFSLGAALETPFWDLSVATQLSTRSITTNAALAGITVAALQFHF